MVSAMMESEDEGCEYPLLTVNSKNLKHVLEWLTLNKEVALDLPENILDKNITEFLPSEYIEYVNRCGFYNENDNETVESFEGIIEILNVANYLDIPEFLAMLCCVCAFRISKKTGEFIRTLFHLENPNKEEEEAEAREAELEAIKDAEIEAAEAILEAERDAAEAILEAERDAAEAILEAERDTTEIGNSRSL